MIPALPGWSVQLLPRGCELHHPAGRDAATIYYVERFGPPRRVVALVGDLCAGWPQFQLEAAAPIERLVTEEGEHAALVRLTGAEAGQPVQRVLGFVLTDDFHTSLAGVSRVPARFAEVEATVRTLVRGDSLGLGVRRRRFEYQPPPGFQPRPRSLTTEWLGPSYPLRETSLLVHPAAPRSPESLDEMLARAIDEHALAEAAPPVVHAVTPTQPAPHGFLGAARSVVADRGALGSPLLRTVVVLRDARYDYPIELRTADAAGHEEAARVLAALVASVQPIPEAGVAPPLAAVLDFLG